MGEYSLRIDAAYAPTFGTDAFNTNQITLSSSDKKGAEYVSHDFDFRASLNWQPITELMVYGGFDFKARWAHAFDTKIGAAENDPTHFEVGAVAGLDYFPVKYIGFGPTLGIRAALLRGEWDVGQANSYEFTDGDERTVGVASVGLELVVRPVDYLLLGVEYSYNAYFGNVKASDTPLALNFNFENYQTLLFKAATIIPLF